MEAFCHCQTHTPSLKIQLLLDQSRRDAWHNVNQYIIKRGEKTTTYYDLFVVVYRFPIIFLQKSQDLITHPEAIFFFVAKVQISNGASAGGCCCCWCWTKNLFCFSFNMAIKKHWCGRECSFRRCLTAFASNFLSCQVLALSSRLRCQVVHTGSTIRLSSRRPSSGFEHHDKSIRLFYCFAGQL